MTSAGIPTLSPWWEALKKIFSSHHCSGFGGLPRGTFNKIRKSEEREERRKDEGGEERKFKHTRVCAHTHARTCAHTSAHTHAHTPTHEYFCSFWGCSFFESSGILLILLKLQCLLMGFAHFLPSSGELDLSKQFLRLPGTGPQASSY